ncbi:MAG: hypothetical protein WKF91_18835 [Segetibacter sp.]
MALYRLKPGTPIEASAYTAGLEDGFISFTSDTNDSNPIPTSLEKVAGFYFTVVDPDDWTCSIPYVGLSTPVYPDDYVITPTVGAKYTMGKSAFEAKYELDGGAS